MRGLACPLAHPSWASSAVLVCGVLLACGGSSGPADGGLDTCYLGDRTASPEVIIVSRLPDGRFVDVVDDGGVTLQEPPQGGQVAFISVRAKNVSCVVQLTASFLDEASGRVGGTEERPVVLRLGASGYGEPEQPAELGNYSNLPACPNGNFRLQQDMFDRPYRLEVRIVDRLGKTATVVRRVVPVCNEAGRPARCRCECGACYSIDHGCAVVVDGGLGSDGGLQCLPVGLDGGL